MGETVEFSLPLPRALDTRIHAHLTLRDRSITLFLTTAAADDQSVPPSMGSFVYAIPDKFNPAHPISTPLYTQESNLEFATRIAKLLAKKTLLPAYVGSSLDLSNMGMGGTAEEEMEAFKTVVEVILAKVRHLTQHPNANSV
ncbi:hypothetical protein VUR80DRAFT_961 [Thermomyces stellatus]